jgi:hypothetical protein
MSAAESFGPGRPRSRWEMLEFNAASFYTLTQLLKDFRSLVEAKKNEKPETCKVSLYNEVLGGGSAIKSVVNGAGQLNDLLRQLNARVTSQIVDELINALHNNRYISMADIAQYYDEIDTTLKRELNLTKLISLSPKEQDLFEPTNPLFGFEFEQRFQTAGAFEVDESAKCLALGRSTASVFHSMRVMEVGIRAVARCLGIPDPLKPAERNWGTVLKAIKDGIEGKWSGSQRMSGDGALFEQIHASLDAVRNPWRNATMHVENKYTDDEAEHIFVAVKGFMKKLSSRMDEDGLPLA